MTSAAAKKKDDHLFTRYFRKPDHGVNVIGICSTGHGAALALVSSKYGVRALTLDRFTGQKHSILFTRREKKEILNRTDMVNEEIYKALNHAYGDFPPTFEFEEVFIPFLKALLKGLPLKPRHIDLVVASPSHFAVNPGRMGKHLNRYFPNAETYLDMEHHHIHQCQAFFGSPFRKAAIITTDQSGESLTRLGGYKIALSLGEGSGSTIRVFKEHVYPSSSPGVLYDSVTQHIGFKAGQEGKTMGLAPYGKDWLYKKLVKYLELKEDGSFRFLSIKDFEEVLRTYAPVRKKGEELTQIYSDIAYAGQGLLEDVMVNAGQALGRMASPDIENLCMAGGVALNSVMNEKVLRGSRFKNMYIMPNASDDGQALGCALFGAVVLRNMKVDGVPDDYLGPLYTGDDILRDIQKAGLKAERWENYETVARMIADGLIVGWFQGQSEFGPRALGNRSILSDPRPDWMKDHLNNRVKHREPFRPFAPVVHEEKAADWFDIDSPSRFMLRVVPVKAEKQKQLAAITHVDGSARIQTVLRKDNERLYDLISAFEKRTGVPVLLNTSFNVNGKPIVETPKDAIDCYLGTGIDALVLGDYILKKNGVAAKA